MSNIMEEKKAKALVFLSVPLIEFGKYYQTIGKILGPGARMDILASEPVERFDEYPEYSGIKLLTCEKTLEEIAPEEIERMGFGKYSYETVIILCSQNVANPYEKLANAALRLTTKRIIFIYNKLFNILAHESIEATNSRLPEESSEFKLKLNRVLQRGLSEVHTSYICIHPYFGFVCRPNSLADFGLKPPPEFGHGVQIEIDRNGFRNSNFPDNKPDDEYWIGLFGGSVAFSIMSTNNSTTISGYLEEILNETKPRKRIRVVNYALPGGQQPQQSIIFLHHLNLLDGIITFDGANETMVSVYNANKIPEHFPYLLYYTALFGQSNLDERIALSWFLENIEKKHDHFVPKIFKPLTGFFMSKFRRYMSNHLKKISTEGEDFISLFLNGPPLEDHEIMEEGARRWQDYILIMRQLAEMRNIETLFLIQPIPEIGKPLSTLEQKILEEHKELSGLKLEAYKRLNFFFDKLRKAGVNCEDFTHVFEKDQGDIYCDFNHFEDRGCRIVAQKIAKIITQKWETMK